MRWIARSLMALLLGAVLAACAQRPAVLTIAEIASGEAQLGTFAQALSEAELTGTFGDANAGPFTVFAPNDAAFAAFAASQGVSVEQLLASEDLADILGYHVVEGSYTSEDLLAAIAAGGSLTTLQGSDLSLTLEGTAIVIDGTARRVVVDLPASNGVVHVINGVLTPPAATQ